MGQPWLCDGGHAPRVGTICVLVGGNQGRSAARASPNAWTCAELLPDVRTASDPRRTGMAVTTNAATLRVSADGGGLGVWPGVQPGLPPHPTWVERVCHQPRCATASPACGPDQASPQDAAAAAARALDHREPCPSPQGWAAAGGCQPGPSRRRSRRVLAVLRDAALNLLVPGWRHAPRSLTRSDLAQFPHQALAMLSQPLTTRA